FFQWRASAGGAEQWHPAMLPHSGTDSPVFAEVCELGALLGRLADVGGARVAEDAAVLWDPECWWALQSPSLPSPDLDYLAAVRRSEEHTSELQSRENLVCRLLLEKKYSAMAT